MQTCRIINELMREGKERREPFPSQRGREWIEDPFVLHWEKKKGGGKVLLHLVPRSASLLRRRSLGSSRNIPPRQTTAEANGTFLSLCSKRSAGEHVEITEEPIGASLLFNRKPIISCDRTTPPRGWLILPRFLLLYMENRVQILASCMEEKNCLNSSGEYKSAWQEFMWTSHT